MVIDKKANIDISDPSALDKAFGEVAPQPIACNNWPEEYPYAPEVSFRMFHTGAQLLLRFDVRECCTMALVTEDNGEVWTDSCVEFFIAPDSDTSDSSDGGTAKNGNKTFAESNGGTAKNGDSSIGVGNGDTERGYYNFETNCAGRMLFAFRKERPKPEYAPKEVMDSVKRSPSLGNEPFAERNGDNRWSVTLAIPATALFRHNITDWSGVNARMNLYKCGDNLSRPHYLSWKPIVNPEPNFHLTEFFENVKFK